jgi:hypothetical protein
MECDVCLIEWDTKFHVPRILSCGHTICEACLLSMFKISKGKGTNMFCPSCMGKQNDILEEGDISKLIKNINLLRIVEKMEMRKTGLKQSFLNCSFAGSFLNTRGKNGSLLRPESSLTTPIPTEGGSFIGDKTIIFSTNELLCSKHNLQIHSQTMDKNSYLCDECIKEKNELHSLENKEGKIRTLPLPNFIRDLRRKVDSTEVKIALIKHEIIRLKDFFSSYQSEFEKTNHDKLEELFEYLRKLIEFNYQSAKTVVNQCKREQQNEISKKVSELDILLSELSELEQQVSFITKSEESDMVRFNEDLSDLYHRVNFFLNYQLELNLLQMQIGIREECKEKLFEEIQGAYYVDVDLAPNINNEPPMIKHVLMKDKYWPCLCGEIENEFSSPKCLSCGNFRKIESLELLVTNPMDVTKDEISYLTLRRKQETKAFQELYQIKPLKDEKNYYYAIDIEWFLLWKAFVTNDLSDKHISNSKKRISANKRIGVLPPGPITNSNLFPKECKVYNFATLRKNMLKNDDYIIVSGKLWEFFHSNYNGGPLIQLKSNLTIYSDFIQVKESRFIYENLRTKKKDELNLAENEEEKKDGLIIIEAQSNENEIEVKSEIEKQNKKVKEDDLQASDNIELKKSKTDQLHCKKSKIISYDEDDFILCKENNDILFKNFLSEQEENLLKTTKTEKYSSAKENVVVMLNLEEQDSPTRKKLEKGNRKYLK